MAETYKPGFKPRGGTIKATRKRVYHRDDAAERGLTRTGPRRQVGDVDLAARAEFQRELRGETKSQPVKPAEPADKSSTYLKSSGKVRTRKERIDFEVERAEKGR